MAKPDAKDRCAQCNRFLLVRYLGLNFCDQSCRDKQNEYARRYYKINLVKKREYMKLSYIKHNHIRRESARSRRRLLKASVLKAYGGMCSCCGEKTPEFLTLDHINNDGKIHRLALRSPDVMSWAAKNGFPKDNLSLRCFNCNLGRELRENKICPHKDH